MGAIQKSAVFISILHHWGQRPGMGEGSPGMDMEQQQEDIQTEAEAQEGRGQSAGEDRLPLDSAGTGDIPVAMRNARSVFFKHS